VRLAQRLILNTVVVAMLLVGIVLLVVERRLTERVRTGAATAQDSDEFLFRMRRDIVVAGVVVLFFGVGFARLLARPVARPLEELSEVAHALAAGDLSRRPLMEGPGEVGDLDDALRQLAEQLDSRIKALQAEEAFLVALTESMNEGVIAVDRRGRVLRINETARALLRVREPVPFPADYLPNDRALRDAMSDALRGSGASDGETTLHERSLALSARPLPAGGAVLTLYDLTPFQRLEDVRRDFVANVSHELRTPLTIISGFVETLQDESIPPALRQQFLGMASGNVRRMQRIVDDLLDLSRIESGGWLPNPEEIDVASLAEEIAAPLQETARSKGLALRVTTGEDATEVFVDSTAARQVLSNLAENAIRHTSEGEVVLFSEKDGDGVWLGVRDTGIGIAAEHVPRIFERFYRADPGRSREAGGTGLGLAIVKHLAEAHQGRVRVDSSPGVGTTIAAWFPSNVEGAE
jgi:two-component system, OmpR family, phosphate regulon sensor histidine kinase PhoR